ncbi:hypothetical protein HanPSC8_Chr14g0622751 [Helianthus annuus]|nr:hypothetical protein HanPSC8_Chr14g0622751 [Helianthus annuus]
MGFAYLYSWDLELRKKKKKDNKTLLYTTSSRRSALPSLVRSTAVFPPHPKHFYLSD